MEKEEKKADLEQLLNSLIEKGWRIENPNARISDVKYMYWLRELRIVYETDLRDVVRQYPIRFLVSKESNLWQFCVKNEMIKAIWSEIEIKNLNEWYWVVRDTDYQYWLIESSLKDESELEDFLLNSIKLD